MQNGNIGVHFQRSQGHRGLSSSSFLHSWRGGGVERSAAGVFHSISVHSLSPWALFSLALCWPTSRDLEGGCCSTWPWLEVWLIQAYGAVLSQRSSLIFFLLRSPIDPLPAPLCSADAGLSSHVKTNDISLLCHWFIHWLYVWISRYYIHPWAPRDGAGRIFLKTELTGSPPHDRVGPLPLCSTVPCDPAACLATPLPPI